jgi:hypothetical protein
LLHGDHTHEKVVPSTVVEPVVAPGVTLLVPTVVVKGGMTNEVVLMMVSSPPVASQSMTGNVTKKSHWHRLQVPACAVEFN